MAENSGEQSVVPDQAEQPVKVTRGPGGYWLAEVLLAFVVLASIVFAIPRATEEAMSYERSVPSIGRMLYELSVTWQCVVAGLVLAPWLVMSPMKKQRGLRIGYLLIAACSLVALLLTIAGSIDPP